MKSLTVLISGHQGSGKTSLAVEIAKRINEGKAINAHVELMTFAKPLYDIHDMILKYMSDLGFAVPKKDGALLQWLGTEWGRKNFGENVWVDLVKKKIAKWNVFARDNLFKKDQIYVISDARFPNEIVGFDNVLKIRLDCPAAVRKERILSTPGQNWRENSAHPSETSLDYFDGWDMVLYTDVLDLNQAAEQVVSRIKVELS